MLPASPVLAILLAAGCDMQPAAVHYSPMADTVAVVLEAPERVRAGRPVQFRLRLANTTDRRISLHLQGRDITWDVVVSRPDGTPVWSRLAGATVLGILRLQEMEPGEEIVMIAAWDQRDDEGRPVPRGEYTVLARLPTDGAPLQSAPVVLRLTP